jgi:putative endonuclease
VTRAPPGPIGGAAEDRALRLLLAQGLTLVGRNFRCRVGEIDLIMRDGPSLVFVEVR